VRSLLRIAPHQKLLFFLTKCLSNQSINLNWGFLSNHQGIKGVTIYRATIYRNTKMQQYISWKVTICIVDSPPKIKITVWVVQADITDHFPIAIFLTLVNQFLLHFLKSNQKSLMREPYST